MPLTRSSVSTRSDVRVQSFELLDHFDRLEPPHGGLGRMDDFGNPFQEIDIAYEGGFDIGPEDFDSNLASVRCGGKMHLRNGGCSNRADIKFTKEITNVPAKFNLDDFLRQSAIKRGQGILQRGEVIRQFFAQQIGSGGQGLTQLDEARPHILKGPGQTLTGPPVRALAPQQPGNPERRGRRCKAGKRKQRIMPGQYGSQPEHPEYMSNGSDHQETLTGVVTECRRIREE